MTSLCAFDHTQTSQRASDQRSSTPVMVSQIFALLARQTSCSRSQDMVRSSCTTSPFRLLTSIIDLISYCAKENVPFTVFETWDDILKEVKRIVSGETNVKEAAEEGYALFKSGKAGVKVNGEAQ